MAYSLIEEAQLNTPKSSQYYPEEYDYSSYYHKLSEGKTNYFTDQTKKSKRASTSINYINERKCPIYVHQYNRVQSASVNNNYPSSKTTAKPSFEKSYSSKPKKIPGYPTTKSVLDQLEETYWATWKPNKENVVNMPKKNRAHDSRISKIEAYGDVPDDLTNYYASTEYKAPDVTPVEESEYEKYNEKFETVIDMNEVESRKHPTRTKTNTQEIQTESALALPKIEEKVENDEVPKKGQEEIIPEETIEKVEEPESPTEKSSDEDPEESPPKEKSKLLKHTDSFIIHKKKQGEVKEHFQQPKCIRLYRKPGISTSFIRGGSYPLKSCLKREPTPKGNFRLGAPGSPLFVSTSSFHKKSKK